MTDKVTHELGFIGAGNMAEAIARGAIAGDVVAADRMIAYDPAEARRSLFAELGIAVASSGGEVARRSGQVLLAVKPQVMPEAAGELAGALEHDPVLISIMAGVRTAKLGAALGRAARIIRVMPNTPLMVGRGMAGVARGGHARPGDEALAMRLFSVGRSEAIAVDEAALDAITAVSGSGPAYVFYLAEAMEAAARELGLAEHARRLVSQTLVGAATLLAESPDDAATLRRKVTSPGGTTQAAIERLDAGEVSRCIVEAIRAAEKRSRELGA